MELTRRRKECLEKVVTLYRKSGLPVHYAGIAELLGVTKWSAYEMLRKLEKEGFLATEYAVNPEARFPGRSMVFFRPTAQALGLVESKERKNGCPGATWEQVRPRLLHLCTMGNTKAIAEELLNNFGNNSSLEYPFFVSAYILSLLVIYLRSLSHKSIAFLEELLHQTTAADEGFSVFAGVVIGSVLRTAAQFPLATQLAQYVRQLQAALSRLGTEDVERLRQFLLDALSRVLDSRSASMKSSPTA